MFLSLIVTLFATTSLAMSLCHGSNGAQYAGSYTDGSGTYISSDSVTHPYKFPRIRKCWYDYYVVNASLYNGAWRKSTGDILCSGTFTCTVSSLNGTEYCQTRTNEVSIEIGLESPGISAEDGGPTFGIDYTTALSTTGCYSASDTKACQWSDGGCHNVWTQQQILKQLGYTRQVCDWGNGAETECMLDIEIDTPTALTNYECGAECGTGNMVIAPTSTSSLIASTTTLPASTLTVQDTTTKSSSSSSSTSSALVPVTVTVGSPLSATMTSTSTSGTSLPSPSLTSSSQALTPRAKAGIAIGSIAAAAMWIALVIWGRRSRKDAHGGSKTRSHHRSREQIFPPAYGNDNHERYKY